VFIIDLIKPPVRRSDGTNISLFIPSMINPTCRFHVICRAARQKSSHKVAIFFDEKEQVDVFSLFIQ